MKKISIILLALGMLNTLAAQISLPESWQADTTRSELQIRANYDAQSSSLRRSFTSALLKGGELTNDDIDGTYDLQNKLNRLGRASNFELTYIPRKLKVPGTRDFSWVIQASHQSFLSLAYTQDFFGLAFYGNARYVGDSLDLSGLYFQQMSWQSIGAGLQHKATKSWLTLNFVHQNTAFQGEIDEAYFYTSADSSEISAKVKGRFAGTYQNQFSQGYGVSLNGQLNFAVERNKGENLIFQVALQNLGMARTYHVVTYEADTSIQFSGFKFSELLNWNTSAYESNNWRDTLGLKTDTLRTVWMAMPAIVQVAKIINPGLKQDFQMIYGIRAYPFIRMFPKIYVGADYRIKNLWHVGLTASYGGFGNFRAGAYVNYTAKKWYAGIGTEDLAGAVSRFAFGQMINFRLICAF